MQFHYTIYLCIQKNTYVNTQITQIYAMNTQTHTKTYVYALNRTRDRSLNISFRVRKITKAPK